MKWTRLTRGWRWQGLDFFASIENPGIWRTGYSLCRFARTHEWRCDVVEMDEGGSVVDGMKETQNVGKKISKSILLGLCRSMFFEWPPEKMSQQGATRSDRPLTLKILAKLWLYSKEEQKSWWKILWYMMGSGPTRGVLDQGVHVFCP